MVKRVVFERSSARLSVVQDGRPGRCRTSPPCGRCAGSARSATRPRGRCRTRRPGRCPRCRRRARRRRRSRRRRVRCPRGSARRAQAPGSRAGQVAAGSAAGRARLGRAGAAPPRARPPRDARTAAARRSRSRPPPSTRCSPPRPRPRRRTPRRPACPKTKPPAISPSAVLIGTRQVAAHRCGVQASGLAARADRRRCRRCGRCPLSVKSRSNTPKSAPVRSVAASVAVCRISSRSSWATIARLTCSSAALRRRWRSASSRARRSESSRRCCASRRSVRSRVTLAKPTSTPRASRSAVMTTLAQNSVPSLRTRQPSSSKRPSRAATSSSYAGCRRARAASV